MAQMSASDDDDDEDIVLARAKPDDDLDGELASLLGRVGCRR